MEIKPSVFLGAAIASVALLGLALSTPARAQVPLATMVGRPAVMTESANLVSSDAKYLYVFVDGQSKLYKIDKASMKIVGRTPLY